VPGYGEGLRWPGAWLLSVLPTDRTAPGAQWASENGLGLLSLGLCWVTSPVFGTEKVPCLEFVLTCTHGRFWL
jgi:hypothetical protein